jgi:fibronectin-binding autotransporter adhesin
LTVNAVNTYTGSTRVNAGFVIVSSTGSLGVGALNLGNANTSLPPTQNGLFLYDAAQTVGPLSGTIASAATGNTASIFLSSATTLTINQTAAVTFQGNIYGGGNLVLGGASNNILTLTGNSTYTGSAAITGGTIQLNVPNALPTGTALSFAATVGTGTAATLNLNGFSQTMSQLWAWPAAS